MVPNLDSIRVISRQRFCYLCSDAFFYYTRFLRVEIETFGFEMILTRGDNLIYPASNLEVMFRSYTGGLVTDWPRSYIPPQGNLLSSSSLSSLFSKPHIDSEPHIRL